MKAKLLEKHAIAPSVRALVRRGRRFKNLSALRQSKFQCIIKVFIIEYDDEPVLLHQEIHRSTSINSIPRRIWMGLPLKGVEIPSRQTLLCHSNTFPHRSVQERR